MEVSRSDLFECLSSRSSVLGVTSIILRRALPRDCDFLMILSCRTLASNYVLQYIQHNMFGWKFEAIWSGQWLSVCPASGSIHWRVWSHLCSRPPREVEQFRFSSNWHKGFWILSAHQVVQSILFKCLACFQTHPSSFQSLMADFPVPTPHILLPLQAWIMLDPFYSLHNPL